jgi:hypothetical protein
MKLGAQSGLGRRARSLGAWAGSCLAALWQQVRAARPLVVAPLALGVGALAGVAAYLAAWSLAPAWLIGGAGALLGQARSLAHRALLVRATGL